ncbi:MAG: type II toxin-antitoxin system RatA family toxin [Gammaproteobacteria bacterium]|nr:type II toxin-antitoxin system RatA family toxin [Gammaproteobacteria bacterium]
MPVVTRQAIVPYSDEEMFDLVNDIEKYPEFLPWCSHAIVHLKEPNQVEATLEVKKGPVTFQFRTRNHLARPSRMEMHLQSGPLRSLEGYWVFQSLGQSACKIDFTLSFEFEHRALSLSLTPILNHIANTFLNAFCERARALHD